MKLSLNSTRSAAAMFPFSLPLPPIREYPNFSVKSKEDETNSSVSKGGGEEYHGKIMTELKFTTNGDSEFDDIAISVEVATEERWVFHCRS